MSELVLRPRSATELIDAAFQVYRRSPVPFIVAMALIYVPWLGVRLLLKLDVPDRPDQLTAGLVRLATIGGAAALLLYCLAGGVGFVLARAVYLDEPLDIANAFRRTFTRLPQLLLATIIEFILVGIGFLFLIVPGVYLAAQFFAVRQAILLEDAGPFRALGRSTTLSSGQKLHILGTLILITLLALVVDGGAAMLIGLQPSKALTAVLLTGISIVVYPLFVITETVLYFDTRIRKEGFDVEYLAGAASDGAAATGLTA